MRRNDAGSPYLEPAQFGVRMEVSSPRNDFRRDRRDSANEIAHHSGRKRRRERRLGTKKPGGHNERGKQMEAHLWKMPCRRGDGVRQPPAGVGRLDSLFWTIQYSTDYACPDRTTRKEDGWPTTVFA